MANGTWEPPIDVSTLPAPGSGYTGDAWWQVPLGEVLESVSQSIQEATGHPTSAAPTTTYTPPVSQAGFAGPVAGIPMWLLLAGGVGALVFFAQRRRRRR